MATSKNDLLREVGQLRAALERFLTGECAYFKGPYGACMTDGPPCPVCNAAQVLGVWRPPSTK